MFPCLTSDNYSFSDTSSSKVSEEIVASAIAEVVQIARYEGKSLEELVGEVLAEDTILDKVQRRWLSKIVTQAWKSLP